MSFNEKDILADDPVLQSIAEELFRDIHDCPFNEPHCVNSTIITELPILEVQDGFDLPENIVSLDSIQLDSTNSFFNPKNNEQEPSSSSSFGSEASLELGAEAGCLKMCRICGREAGKHNYYGAQACNSCRAFFRRAVQSNTFPNFRCLKFQDCAIDSKSWKSCQWCRFQKCQTYGMRTNWVLNESERKSRNDKRKECRNKRMVSYNNEMMRQQRMISHLFTLDDEIHIRGLVVASYDFCSQEGIKYYAANPGTLEVMMEALYYGKTFPFDLQRNMEKFMLYSIRKFYAGMADMMEISTRDQCLLVEKNYPIIFDFYQAVFLDSGEDSQKFLAIFQTKLKELAKVDQFYRDIETRVNEFSSGKALQVQPMRYNQVYHDGWTEDESVLEKHKQLNNKINQWPREVQNDFCDEILVTLMTMMLLFSTDELDLENPHIVDKVQTKYANLMYKYLKTKFCSSVASSKFCNAMSVTSMSRELREIRNCHIYKEN